MSTQTLRYPSPRHLHQLYASREDNLSFAEKLLGVTLVTRDEWIKIDGPDAAVQRAETLFSFLNEARNQGLSIRTPDFVRFAEMVARGEADQLRSLFGEPLVVTTNRKTIVPKTLGQKLYLQSILKNPIVFSIG
ncbi:MAG TPA: PhoH family protein, partial [Opitutaceae bacterium]